MSNAEEYLAKAVECDEQAKEIKDLEFKRLLCETAKNWRKLAEYARLQEERTRSEHHS
jgi:hypothetical protein